MNIAILADPEIPVPPIHYGGIERIVDMLVKGLIAQGHEVTLFAHPDSSTQAKPITYPGKSSQSKLDTLKNLFFVGKKLYTSKFDVVHSFARLIYLSAILPDALPKIMSYQREPSLPGIRRAYRLAKKKSLVFTGCSEYIAAQIRDIAPSFSIYNGCPIDLYKPNYSIPVDAPMIFLGRIEYIKGVHLAIEVAQKTKLKLIIAGNIPDRQETQTYFLEQIKPHIDGQQIVYVGPVDDTQKNALLSQAYCFLMPILWNEPFGIVMAEAMACGTPVIGFSRGAVPEVITHGEDGFHCNNVDEMAHFVSKIGAIDRKAVRKSFENKFSDRVIVEQYLALYNTMLQNK